MDTLGINKLVEELIKDFETSETHSVLFYSSDKTRDFKLLALKVKDYRGKLSLLLANNGSDDINTVKARNSARKEDLSKELL